jgi:hypothetical protein
MSGPIIDQLNLFIMLIKDHKQQVLSVRDYKDKNKKEDGVVLDTEPPVETNEEKTD